MSDSTPESSNGSGNESVTAQVSSLDGKVETGTFVVRHLSSVERVQAGFKWLGISWAIAVGFILVPIIHFIAVPLFAILGPIGFFYAFSSSTRIEGGEVKCPICAQAIHLPQARFKQHIKESCTHCLNQIYIDFK